MQVPATVNYHVAKDEPQFFRFDPDGRVGELIAPELLPTRIQAHDLRSPHRVAPEFTRDGLLFIDAPSSVLADRSDNAWQSVYNREVEELLTRELDVREVVVFDHTVRIDDEQAVRRPARNVHTDYSRRGAEDRLVDIVGEERAAEFRRSGFGVVSLRRPLGDPVLSSPLGCILPASLDPGDWIDIELRYPDRRGHILGVVPNEAHQWVFLSEMQPDEVAIFNFFDSSGLAPVAHSALDLMGQSPVVRPRRSIETRTLVRYG
mgnify:CR=1 FL=1